MIVHKPKINPLALSALAEIQAAGAEITPDIVLWLHDAAERIKTNQSRDTASMIDWPTPCGGALLYPLSFGAVAWVTRLPKHMQSSSIILGFACANSFNLDVLEKINGAILATFHATKWAMKLKCSQDALDICVDSIIGCGNFCDVPDLSQRENKKDDYQWGAVIKALCAKYPSTSPEYWMWHVSREKCIEMLSESCQENSNDPAPTEHEKAETNNFYSIVQSIKDGTYGG